MKNMENKGQLEGSLPHHSPEKLTKEITQSAYEKFPF